jgi:hypothetical protein
MALKENYFILRAEGEADILALEEIVSSEIPLVERVRG